MKVKVEFELTPEEMHRLLGIPDASKLQALFFEQIKESLKAGDTETVSDLIKPFAADMRKEGSHAVEAYQNLIGGWIKMATLGKVDLSSYINDSNPDDGDDEK